MNSPSSQNLSQKIINSLNQTAATPQLLMEVCGTHTVSIFKSGIRSVLPPTITLLSGPGCPVCVTDQSDIDLAIEIASQKNTIMLTYGDMLRVPGTKTSLRDLQTQGADIRIILSTMEAIQIAQQNPTKTTIFLAVGFETTTPQTAIMIETAQKLNIKNLAIIPLHKQVMPALQLLASDPQIPLQGFLLPGHVSSIIGTQTYQPLAQTHKIACAIGGFEPNEILLAIASLSQQIATGAPQIHNLYPHAVKPQGNPKAQSTINQIFTPSNATWRGIGTLPNSGLTLKPQYQHFDAPTKLGVSPKPSTPPQGCLCGQVLTGKITPNQCPSFAKTCTPFTPIGPCMVSSEGSCSAWYKYNRL